MGDKYHIMKYFAWAHLPERLQAISRPFYELAKQMAETLPEGPEVSAALRKLLEAKDCAVRAAL
jgi:ferritin-like protein